MSEFQVLDTNVSVLDRVEFAADGRVEYEQGRLRCLYPKGSDTTEYVVARFNYSGPSDTVSLPDGTVVLGYEREAVLGAVPLAAYGDENQ